MILTLTPNPTIDRAVFCRDFCLGDVVRAERETVTPSGKGIDAAKVIHELGGDTLTVGLKAGITGEQHSALLAEQGVQHDFVPALGETRTLVVLVDLSAGKQSSISAATLRATSQHLPQLISRLEQYAERSWGLLCGGSLPPGLPPDSYARVLRWGRQQGLATLLDTSGEPLRHGVQGMPHILKINRQELTLLDPEASGDVLTLTTALRHRLGTWASEALVVTLGEQGALAVTAAGTYRTHPPQVPIANTAGAGDALGAGIMLARRQGADWPAALALGTAAAASVVMNEGTGICRREQVESLLDQVGIEEL
jgi:1-phosphofructokinase family hexose kinase